MSALRIAPPKSRWKYYPEQIEDPHSEEGLQVSEEVYWEKYYEHPDFNYEWNNGILEEKPVGDYSKYLMYRWFVEILEHFLRVYPIAKTIGLEIGFRLALPAKTSIRKPDLGVILNDNPVPIGQADRTYAGIYDLCIESLSDSSVREIKRDVVYKKEEYEKIQVKEYYILDDHKTYTAFYRLNKAGIYEAIAPDKDGVIHSGVLPGFQFRAADLYRQPSLIEMSEDATYRSFILPEYQAEKRRAEKTAEKLLLKEQAVKYERERANYEKERAEKAEEALNRLRTKLQSLGLSPD